MTVTVNPATPRGTVTAIPSKSVAHRMLICSAFASASTFIVCPETNKDIEATVACLRALGAEIDRAEDGYSVSPIAPEATVKGALLPCGESGSTLRFLLPVVAALGAEATFKMEGRLPERPLSPLWEELEAHGIELSRPEADLLKVSGRLHSDSFSIRGDVSSQFISGLLLALSLLPQGGKLCVLGKTESAPYVRLTLDALSAFGCKVCENGGEYAVSASALVSPARVEVEGDWSNAAFPLCLGVIGNGSVRVERLDPSSHQGDLAVIELLRRFGAELSLTEDGNGYIASASELHGIEIDATQIPDLVPILATVASVAKGRTVIYGASRLRLEESDRLESVCATLTALGADVTQTEDGLIINGKSSLSGGRVDSYNDHRIAMSAAIAAAVCESPVTIDRAEATAKSYPSFWSELARLGLSCKAE